MDDIIHNTQQSVRYYTLLKQMYFSYLVWTVRVFPRKESTAFLWSNFFNDNTWSTVGIYENLLLWVYQKQWWRYYYNLIFVIFKLFLLLISVLLLGDQAVLIRLRIRWLRMTLKCLCNTRYWIIFHAFVIIIIFGIFFWFFHCFGIDNLLLILFLLLMLS